MRLTDKLAQAERDGLISATAKKEMEKWLVGSAYAEFVDELKAQIEAGDFEALNDAFYQVIPFGTGGRRGPVGLGSNRMNLATLAESAQGMANKLKKEISGRNPRVAVAYDTRLTSPAFTLKTACVLAGNGIEVYLFEGPRATPELSFAVGDLKLDAGIVISASHNPPEDNGFKAYWNDGGQVVPPLDAELIDDVKQVREIAEISFEEAYGKGLIHRLGSDYDDYFCDAILKQSLSSERDVKIVYSPLHGTGLSSVFPVLKRGGFKDLHLVESQKDLDGRFPNVPDHKPNPEVTTGFNDSIKLAEAIKADVVMVSDPDADRLSMAVLKADGQSYQILTGNQCSALMMDYIAKKMKAAGTLKSSHRVYSTCVSSPLMPSIARAYGLTVNNDLLVGFKWIAEKIKLQDNPDDFLFGSEESIGFMKGSQTRDKDAAVAALIFAELTAEAKAEGRTVLELLDDIYRTYGYYCDAGTAIFFEGLKGSEKMGRIMDHIRRHPFKKIGDYPVSAFIDRQSGEVYNSGGVLTGTIKEAKSNVLIFHLDPEGKSWVAVRPSGTEPKIKFYFSLHKDVSGDLEAFKVEQQAILQNLLSDMKNLALSIE